MEKTQKGKLIVSAAKSLKRFQLGDPTIAALLYATSHAGRAGLFASALRHSNGMSLSHLTILAAEEGFGLPDLRSQLIPWIEDSGLCRINRDKQQVISVDSLVLSYEGLLSAVSDFYDSLNHSLEDLGCLHILEIAYQLPTPEPDVLHAVALIIGEEKAKTAVSLAKNYKIVAYREGKGLKYPVLYSERLWSRCIDRAALSLSPLKREQREAVLSFVEQVRKYQGFPEGLLRNSAKQNNIEPMLDLAIGVHLLNSSLKHNILILESRILRHSLGDPDMAPEYLRAYHNMLFRYDYGRYEEDYGATYQQRIDTFMSIRKKVAEIPEGDIKLINSVFPEFELWWEKLWGSKKEAKIAKKKEGN